MSDEEKKGYLKALEDIRAYADSIENGSPIRYYTPLIELRAELDRLESKTE